MFLDISKLSFENHILQYRLSKNLTQQELADILGVSRNSICSYERNKFQPSIEIALLLCLYFECSMLDMFSFHDL